MKKVDVILIIFYRTICFSYLLLEALSPPTPLLSLPAPPAPSPPPLLLFLPAPRLSSTPPIPVAVSHKSPMKLANDLALCL